MSTHIYESHLVLSLMHSLHVIRDPTKDKPLELELGWLTEGTNWNFVHVPKELVQEADKYGLNVVGVEGSIVDTGASTAADAGTETAGVPVEDAPMEISDL